MFTAPYTVLSQARGGGSDIRFNTSLSGSVSGVETNNLDLTFPAGISPENASAVINAIKLVTTMLFSFTYMDV